MGRQIAPISSEHSYLWSGTESGISLFVCLVTGSKMVEIVGLQPSCLFGCAFFFPLQKKVGINATLLAAKCVIFCGFFHLKKRRKSSLESVLCVCVPEGKWSRGH